MSSRKNSGMPALYELIGRRRSNGPPVRVEEPPPPPPSPVESGGSWLSPGRMLRVPVGYLLLGLATAIALMVGAYVMGYRQASVAVRQEYAQGVLGGAGTVDPLTATDPLEEDAGPTSGTGLKRVLPSDAGTRLSTPPVAVDDQDAGTGWGPLFSDPRESGMNYFVLMQTSRDGAARVARFCRDHGLETYVVGRNNASTFKVIAFPGFQSAERSGPDVRDLEALIHRIGDKWRREEGGATDFRDKYPSLYGN